MFCRIDTQTQVRKIYTHEITCFTYIHDLDTTAYALSHDMGKSCPVLSFYDDFTEIFFYKDIMKESYMLNLSLQISIQMIFSIEEFKY